MFVFGKSSTETSLPQATSNRFLAFSARFSGSIRRPFCLSANDVSGMPTDGYSFHYCISGNGGQYTLSVSSYGDAWLYEVDASHPSTWIVCDDSEGASDNVQFGSSGYARIGNGWIWVDKPDATKVLVPKKNGEIHQVGKSGGRKGSSMLQLIDALGCSG